MRIHVTQRQLVAIAVLSLGGGLAAVAQNLTVSGTGSFGSTISAAAPTASNHVATKGYVDGLSNNPTYQGMTSGTYNGTLGGSGILTANSACNSAFSGSHMCGTEEIRRTGVSSISASGWLDPQSGTIPCGAGQLTAWQTGDTEYSGTGIGSGGHVTVYTCDNTLKIHCCK